MFTAFDDRRYLIPFRSQLLPHILTDTLVIGGGVAGMRAALEAAKHGDVILLTKKELNTSNTAWARGGIAAAHGPGDSPDAHFQDTLTAGAGLCDAGTVRTLVDEGASCIEELLAWDMRFDRNDAGQIAYGREGAHSENRVLHTDGADTGRELVRCLGAQVLAHESIRVFDECFALDLLTNDTPGRSGEHRVLGAITHHPRYGLQIVWANATILATGGTGMVYRETTNPRIATGDGIAMAYRAGALVSDLEFVQFHPTTLYVAGAGRFLISEAVRGEGAYLVDQDEHRFMPEYHELAELAPRDVVSRAIIDQLAQSQADAVYLDLRHIGAERLGKRFPGFVKELAAFDLDPNRDLIPVHPSAHYSVGGVWTDQDGRANLPGLFACGEVAANGLHGANRLASNSLLEGLVYGRRAGRAAEAPGRAAAPIRIVSDIAQREQAELDIVDVRGSLRSAMWRNVGIERTGQRLDDVQEMFHFWARYTMYRILDEPTGWESQNMLTVGALLTRAARWRTETRGVHCRVDFPDPDENLLVHTQWRKGSDEPILVPVDLPAEART